MDEAFADQRARLTREQFAAVREWQRTDRFYEQVQGLVRGTLAVDATSASYAALRHRAELLDDAIDSPRTTRPLTVYRGVRSLRWTFGEADPAAVRGPQRTFEGYTAASVLRSVAVDEFVGPAGALLELEVPPGIPALWVAGLGDPRLRRQGEVLFPVELPVQITGVRHDDDLVVLSVQVVNP
ncbi:MAG: hypothetical protein M0P31_13275 [Solirubrobacteraceae bacterium]|nr:hypothetical protein [Solirubrobacteraceae bacterium]